MAYKYDEAYEMNLDEYFQKYKDYLPQLAVITGGIYGRTKFDDYASDQVMRFHRYITQSRVLGKQTTITGDEKYLSFPMDTNLKFQVIKGRNKFGPEEDLKTILKRNKFPVFVNTKSHHPLLEVLQLPSGRSCQILLTEERTEYYIQGHCMTNDKFNPCDVSTIVIIPDIKVTAITGYTDKPDDAFKQDLKRFAEMVKTRTKFNDKDVDQDIRTVEVKKDVQKDKSDSDSEREYEYIEPPPPLPRGSSNDPKPQRTLPGVPNKLPEIPTTAPKLTAEQIRQYENEKIQRCTVNPMVKEENYYDPQMDENYETMPPEKSKEAPTLHLNVLDNDSCEKQSDPEKDVADVSGKSISDIIEILNKLKLSKYVEMFEDDMVDGMTLMRFTEEELKKEYGMRHAEAVRLMNFVRLGHIPQ